MSLIRNFLEWLVDNQIGILATIVIHLAIVTAFVAVRISTITNQEFAVYIDLSQVIFEDELIAEMIEEREPTVQDLMQTFHQQTRNIPVNVLAQRPAQDIQRMIDEIKAEENITDPVPYTPPTDDNIMPDSFNEHFPLDDATGERTVYIGPTTVSYELSGRHHTHMPRPVYKCRTGGTIVVDIVVNHNGYVISAQINRGRSNSGDPCLVNAAKSAAERSRFNRSSVAQQQGSITYVFQAQ